MIKSVEVVRHYEKIARVYTHVLHKTCDLQKTAGHLIQSCVKIRANEVAPVIEGHVGPGGFGIALIVTG